MQKLLILVSLSSVIISCSSDIMNIKVKDFSRFEKLTIRSDKATLGPFEKVPKEMANQIQGDIDTGACSDVVAIKLNQTFLGIPRGSVSYSCENK